MPKHIEEAKRLFLLGDLIAAKEAFTGLLNDPNSKLDALHGLSLVSYQQNDLSEAIALLHRALRCKGEKRELYRSLGMLYFKTKQWQKASQAYERAIQSVAEKDFSSTWMLTLVRLAGIYLIQKKYEEARKLAIKGLKRNPAEPQLFWILTECHIKRKEYEKGVETLERGLKSNPHNLVLLSRLLTLKIRVCDWKGRDAIIRQIKRLSSHENLAVLQPTTAILAGFTNEEILKVAQARSKAIEIAVAPVRDELAFKHRPSRRKKIRIGYLSSDFHDHATAHLMLDVFALHDRGQFDIYAFSYGKKDRSVFRKKIEEGCDKFFEIQNDSDSQAAQRIHHNKIDLLVDLKGHIVDHRLGILGLRPAPVQIHYLGYPGTIGASFVDYLIADRYVIPDSQRKYYTEKIVYLPHTYQANMEKKRLYNGKITRKDYNLPEGHFVFCCFNQNDKYDPESLSAWMEILQAVPKSVLWVWGNYDRLKKKLSSFGKEKGIEPNRLIVAPTEPNPKHLARMRLADLFLDTFYYGAHTSCSDAIRMGVPVLCCPGKTFASRVAGSLLHSVKAEKLIAKSRREYVSKAVAFATNPSLLRKVTEEMIGQREMSTLFNPSIFTRNLEEAYTAIWEQYLKKSVSQDIYLWK